MEKKTAQVLNLAVNTDLPQCQLPNEIFTKAINFRPENNSLVSINKSAIAPSGGSKPWAALPIDGFIDLPEILRMDFNNSMDNTPANPDANIYWTVNTWHGAPSYVEGVDSSDIAVTNCCFFIAPYIYGGTTPPVPVEISLLITLLSTISDNMLIENTSAGSTISLSPTNHILYQGVDTGRVVALNEYFTLLFQYSSATDKTTLFIKDGSAYINLGDNTGNQVIPWNFEVNSPWGRDMLTERISSIIAYRGLVV